MYAAHLLPGDSRVEETNIRGKPLKSKEEEWLSNRLIHFHFPLIRIESVFYRMHSDTSWLTSLTLERTAIFSTTTRGSSLFSWARANTGILPTKTPGKSLKRIKNINNWSKVRIATTNKLKVNVLSIIFEEKRKGEEKKTKESVRTAYRTDAGCVCASLSHRWAPPLSRHKGSCLG